ncbi:uncharacterized protein LOC144553976 [Carex rostrata]
MHATAPISVSDELKKEAEMLLKRYARNLMLCRISTLPLNRYACLKWFCSVAISLKKVLSDMLCHLQVIEDMSIQANVTALAMEEVCTARKECDIDDILNYRACAEKQLQVLSVFNFGGGPFSLLR